MIDNEALMESFALYAINKGTGILAIVLYFVVMLSLYPAVTSAFFFAYALLFAQFRKKPVTRKRFTVSCLCVNVAAHVALTFFSGFLLSFNGYVVWTLFARFFGMMILRRRGILKEPLTSQEEAESLRRVFLPPRPSMTLCRTLLQSMTMTLWG